MAWIILVPFIVVGAFVAFAAAGVCIAELLGRLLRWLEDHVAVPW